MNKFIQWYYRYNTEITWFIIGWLALNAIHDLGRGDWFSFIIDSFLIALNYSFWRR